jgi:hypothetical protein
MVLVANTVSIVSLSIMTLNIKISIAPTVVTLSVVKLGVAFFNIMLGQAMINIVILSVVKLGVTFIIVLLSVVMMNVVLSSVVSPQMSSEHKKWFLRRNFVLIN